MGSILKTESNEKNGLVGINKISDESILMDIVKNAEETDIRCAAIKKSNSISDLVDFAKTSDISGFPSTMVYDEIMDKIDDESILIDIAKNASGTFSRFAAIEKISDADALIDIFDNETEEYILERFPNTLDINKICDESILAKLAVNGYNDDIRHAAINKINDGSVLFNIAMNISGWLGDAAVRKINDDALLKRIVIAYDSSKFYMDTSMAVKGIKNDDILLDIINDSNLSDTPKYYAARNIKNESILIDLANKTNLSIKIRQEAIKKISNKAALLELTNDSSADYIVNDRGYNYDRDRADAAYYDGNVSKSYPIKDTAHERLKELGYE